MQTKTVTLADDFSIAVTAAAEVLRGGGVIVLPTDTVYGLAVIEGCPEAEAALRSVKGRGETQPFQRLIADDTDLLTLGAVVSPAARSLMAAFWPGALTLVLPCGWGGTVGVRRPDFAFVRELVRSVGRPIIATSANAPGAASVRNGTDAARMFARRVGLVVDGGKMVASSASAVVDMTQRKMPILRTGTIDAAALRLCVAPHTPENQQP